MPRPATTFRPLGAATPVVEATAGCVSALVFGAASALRRARIFHPDGAAFRATVRVMEGTTVVPPGRHEAVVRFSRGIGLPEPAPDILGFALRLVDLHGPGAHQDLLFVTSGDRPGARHALVFTRRYAHHRWSSLLPYRVGGRRVVFGARPISGPSPKDLAALRKAAATGRLRFALEVAEPTGAWEEVGVIDIGDALGSDEADALHFNPANTGGGIEPIGLLQTLRRRAYAGSQRGRPDTD
jgi:hypothetical protein